MGGAKAKAKGQMLNKRDWKRRVDCQPNFDLADKERAGWAPNADNH